MSAAQMKAILKTWEAARDLTTYSARDFELRAVKTKRNRDNTISTDVDGTRWAWDESREIWARTV